MMNGNTTFDENGVETISIFPNKTQKTRFFRLFSENPKKISGSFWPQKNERDNFFQPFFKIYCMYSKEKIFSKKKMIFFMKKVARRTAPQFGLMVWIARFFLDALPNSVQNHSFFLGSSLMQRPLVFL